MTNIKKIFIDMDDTLFRFRDRMCEVTGTDKQKAMEYMKDTRLDPFDDFNRCLNINRQVFKNLMAMESFWEDMKVVPNSKDLMDLCTGVVGIDSISIATTPQYTPACFSGKLRLLQKRNLTIPTILIEDKSLLAQYDRVLIDDRPDVCNEFMLAGGFAINFQHDWSNPDINYERQIQSIAEQLKAIDDAMSKIKNRNRRS